MRPGFDSQAVHRVGDQVLEDTPERDRISDDRREIRQVGLELDVLVPLRGAHDVGDQRVQIALAPVRAAATVADSSWPASRDTRCWNRPSGRRSANTAGKGAGLVPFDLRQMAHHVAKRDEAVLDVVVDLPGQLADGGAPFGLAHAGRAGAQPRRKVAEQPRQSADFVRAGIEVDVEAIEIEHGRLFGKSRQRSADARRHPHRQQQRGDAGSRGGQQETMNPRCAAAP